MENYKYMCTPIKKKYIYLVPQNYPSRQLYALILRFSVIEKYTVKNTFVHSY